MQNSICEKFWNAIDFKSTFKDSEKGDSSEGYFGGRRTKLGRMPKNSYIIVTGEPGELNPYSTRS